MFKIVHIVKAQNVKHVELWNSQNMNSAAWPLHYPSVSYSVAVSHTGPRVSRYVEEIIAQTWKRHSLMLLFWRLWQENELLQSALVSAATAVQLLHRDSCTHHYSTVCGFILKNVVQSNGFHGMSTRMGWFRQGLSTDTGKNRVLAIQLWSSYLDADSAR